MIVDEGGMGVSEVYGREFALPGVAEKGYGVSPRRDEWLCTTEADKEFFLGRTLWYKLIRLVGSES
jgi:hypothetical protein